MAIGAARVMGFKLMTNFNNPYQSRSISEFWKRWHISLSTWFKDYLYITLGGNRVSVPRWYFNLFIVFLVSGLWHGANWTYIIWGALHGFYLVFALFTTDIRKRFNKVFFLDKFTFLSVFTTFILVAFAWIFFRASSVTTAFYIIKHIFIGISELFKNDWQNFSLEYLGVKKIDLILSVLLIFLLEGIQYFKKSKMIVNLPKYPTFVRWTVYLVILTSIVLLGVYEERQFIYFQF
jgi:D-alanyl-lipoteichoic acid acyltransferase DltB (MBOAT superfamily)